MVLLHATCFNKCKMSKKTLQMSQVYIAWLFTTIIKNRGKITHNAAHEQGSLALDGYGCLPLFQRFRTWNYQCDVTMVQIPDIQNLACLKNCEQENSGSLLLLWLLTTVQRYQPRQVRMHFTRYTAFQLCLNISGARAHTAHGYTMPDYPSEAAHLNKTEDEKSNKHSWRCTQVFFLLFLLRLLSPSSELDSESDSELDPELEISEPDSDPLDSDSDDSGFCCCIMRRGMFFKYSLRLSVIPPRPMEVKKLMENLVFFGWSLGKIDSKEPCMLGSFSLSLSRRMPRCSDNSWNKIFMKIREEDVVSSSVSRM